MEYAFTFFSESLNKDLDVVCEVESRSQDEFDFEVTAIYDNDNEEVDYESLPAKERNAIHKEAESRAENFQEEAYQSYLENAADAMHDRMKEESWDV